MGGGEGVGVNGGKGEGRDGEKFRNLLGLEGRPVL